LYGWPPNNEKINFLAPPLGAVVPDLSLRFLKNQIIDLNCPMVVVLLGKAEMQKQVTDSLLLTPNPNGV